MSVVESDIQWFIARDGKQHGPLSDVEMQKLLELGHLRQTDLIWKLGFPDWRPVTAVFPASAPAGGKPEAAPARPAPAPSSPSPAPAPTAAAAVPPPRERSQGTPPRRPASNAGSQAETRRWAQPRQDRRAESPGWGRLAIVMSLIAATAGGVWFAYNNSNLILPTAPEPQVAGTKAAPAGGGEKKPAAAKATFETAAVPGAAAIDLEFQKRPLWAAVKGEFPEWYDVRIQEAAKLRAEGKPELEITTHLIEALVALRRQHADKALAASTSRHKELAQAFLHNLRTLAQKSPDNCYNFISKGEASPSTISLLQDAEKSGHIEAQVVAIIAAISEGRKTPVVHAAPVKTDYDALAAELRRIGWTQNDMKLFADPKALAKAPHEQVCNMVQDWFAAHLSIPEPAIQERLLYETLRPVVAG
jgi:GYF domain 2